MKTKFNRKKFIKLKTAKGRKLSSVRWLERQLNDPYVQLSKKEGYRSRAAYKLIEINNKFHILDHAKVVIDLGAAPGSWLQVVSETLKLHQERKIIGLDLKQIDPIDNVDFIKGDFTDNKILENLKNLLGNQKADVILSDMAAAATGITDIDHDRIIMLCEYVFDFAFDYLNIGGTVLVKVLRGGTENKLLAKVKQYFNMVKHIKPKASRDNSAEMYLIAKGFRGKVDNISDL